MDKRHFGSHFPTGHQNKQEFKCSNISKRLTFVPAKTVFSPKYFAFFTLLSTSHEPWPQWAVNKISMQVKALSPATILHNLIEKLCKNTDKTQILPKIDIFHIISRALVTLDLSDGSSKLACISSSYHQVSLPQVWVGSCIWYLRRKTNC